MKKDEKMSDKFDDGVISEHFKCPKCGGDVIVYDTMFAKMWNCVDCDYKDDDW